MLIGSLYARLGERDAKAGPDRRPSSLLALLVGAALALASPPYAVETPIATGPQPQRAPFLSSDSSGITWQEQTEGQWDVVWLRGPESLSVLVQGNQQRPVASGDWLVYEDDRNYNLDIYACDSSLREVPLTTDPADQRDPAIFGLRVVFEDKSRLNWNIGLYDLSTDQVRLLTTNAAAQVDPAIEGNTVVFADRRNGNWDVYCFNLKTATLQRLTTSKAPQTRPQIGHGIVVYQDRRNGNWDVYGYTLATGKERRLTTDKHNQTAPQIRDGRAVVYEDDRSGSADVYLCDLKTGINRRVTDDAAAQTEPSVRGDEIVWCDSRSSDGNGDVYRCSLQFPTLTLRRPETPAYDATVRVNGTLLAPDGLEEGLAVQVTARGKTRSVKVSDSWGSVYAGTYGVTLSHVVRKLTVRALYRGDASHLPSLAKTVLVKPRALLSRPRLWETVEKPASGLISIRKQYVSGYLRPRHAAGSGAVKLEFYRWAYVTWRLQKTVTVKVQDHESYSSYKSRISLGNGSWKVRAVHADADHAETTSSFSNALDVGYVPH